MLLVLGLVYQLEVFDFILDAGDLLVEVEGFRFEFGDGIDGRQVLVEGRYHN